jgi:hypothetical protein
MPSAPASNGAHRGAARRRGGMSARTSPPLHHRCYSLIAAHIIPAPRPSSGAKPSAAAAQPPLVALQGGNCQGSIVSWLWWWLDGNNGRRRTILATKGVPLMEAQRRPLAAAARTKRFFRGAGAGICEPCTTRELLPCCDRIAELN